MSPATAELSDKAVVERVLEGERALFELIMRRHNQRLYRLARAMLRDEHEAEDALQETWIRAYRALRQFQGRARLFTWLAHILVNECRSRIRRRRTRAERETRMSFDRPHDIPADAEATRPDRRADAAELGALITRALDRLPRQMRAVFILREVEGMSTEDAAESLGITPANVKVRLHRARRELRGTLESAMSEETRRLWSFDGHRCDRIIRNVMERIA